MTTKQNAYDGAESNDTGSGEGSGDGSGANPYGALTDVAGILVGQAERIGDGWLTGVTVVVPPRGTIGAVDVRGGGPGTHETDTLAPGTLVDTVDAVTLAGGSSYGLAAATGVQRWCEEQRRGVPITAEAIVPIVPAAIVFDLGKGGDHTKRPDADLGYAAAAAASGGFVRTGCVGAGTGTTFGIPALKGGVGTASIDLGGGLVVGALAVANAHGSPCAPGTEALLAAQLVEDEDLRPRVPDAAEVAAYRDRQVGARSPQASDPMNTTLAVVATNAQLTHSQVHRMASAGHDGLARAIRPVHTLVDGDTVFALATGEIAPTVGAQAMTWGAAADIGGVLAVQAAAADAVALAIVDAILAATGVSTPAIQLQSYLERFPSATPRAYRSR
ncbi:P1 family peptidase [Actinopolymorpha sp. B9G3]|uniref:P1 family peptidase n=1 Tax=Actinopolymorpha sp. B9G3 TaxID=3158970 RepID=UPI0032D8EB61